jgi:signal transduction histidine kinase/ActR/RegA family two-component response regulator
MSFRQQLGLAMAAGVLGLMLLSSAASAWQGSRQVRNNLVQQSLRVTASLASQSKLALLTGSADNASEAVAATLAFPDVLRVELYSANGQRLLARGSVAPSAEPLVNWRQAPHEAYLQDETDEVWRFVAPVWTHSTSNEFEVLATNDEFMGHAVVVLSKASLHQTVTNIVLVNLLSSLFFAALIMFAIRMLSVRLTRPLHKLSDAMARAERGDVDVRTVAEGPRDIQLMSQAFNRMIIALQDRGAEVQRHQDHLETLVSQRTHALEQARDRAEVASQAKTDFLARMSHELRTPLNAIMGYAQILKMDRELSPRQINCLQTIHGSGEHLLTLINDILDLAQIEVGRTELHPTVVQPRAMTRMLDDLIRLKAAEKQLTFVATCNDDVPSSLLTDEKRLRQVLLNLLSNAVKFTSQGIVQLTVSLLQRHHDTGLVRLRFEVQDSGSGIRAEDQQRIFEPFEQAGDARSRAAGTGLGLAISRQLVRLMGGELHLQSQPGLGSRFWFELDIPEAPGTEAIPRPAMLTFMGYEGPRRRILIADDVGANRQMLIDLLQPLGFDVLEAVDGADALAQARREPPDLIFMDLSMPVMDGLEATRRLRADATLGTVPIIALTANASPADQAQALAAGVNDVIAKPFDSNVLLTRLGQLLSLAWTHDPIPA